MAVVIGDLNGDGNLDGSDYGLIFFGNILPLWVPPPATKTATTVTRLHMDIAEYIDVNIAYSLSLISSRLEKLATIL